MIKKLIAVLLVITLLLPAIAISADESPHNGWFRHSYIEFEVEAKFLGILFIWQCDCFEDEVWYHFLLLALLNTNPHRFSGEYFDFETGRIYLRARSYDPHTGRFTQEDPIRCGLNWYTYCENNPIMFSDPTGLSPHIGPEIMNMIQFYGNPTDKQKIQFFMAIEYLKGSPTFVTLWNKLNYNEAGQTIYISINNTGRMSYQHGSWRVNWDPQGALVLANNNVLSPAVGLAHEMGHAAQQLDGFLDKFINGQITMSQMEANNLEVWENPISRELGEHVRARWEDGIDLVNVNNPTHWGMVIYVRVPRPTSRNPFTNFANIFRSSYVYERRFLRMVQTHPTIWWA